MRKKLIKKTILITHMEGASPEVVEIEGENEKDLIYSLYELSFNIMYTLGEDDEILNDIVEGDISKDEILNKIKYHNLEDCLHNLSLKGQYRYEII